jgi:hypothetical protein
MGFGDKLSGIARIPLVRIDFRPRVVESRAFLMMSVSSTTG